MKPVSQAFIDAFSRDTVYLDHKLIVEFGSNRFNDGQVVTASSTKLVNAGLDAVFVDAEIFWKAEDVFNNKNRNTMKWLVLDAGATLNEFADGTGHRCPHIDDGEYERGWWSNAKTNGSGVFASPEWVESVFFEPDQTTPFVRRCNKIVLYLTEGYPNMKEVTVQYKDASGVWINVATNYTLGANEYSVTWNFDVDILISGLRVYINKTQEPDDWARLNELNAFWVQDLSEFVISADTTITREEFEQTVPVGTTASNTFNVRLDNTEGLFNQDNNNSNFAPYIGENNRVEWFLGVDINGGVGSSLFEYIQMGEFWTDDWESSSSDTTASFNCRDFSKFLMDDTVQWGRYWKNTDTQTVFRELLLYMGLSLDRIVIDPVNMRQFPIVFMHQISPWQLMGELAFADQGMFGFNFDGSFEYQSYNRLNMAPFTTPVLNMSSDDFIIDGHLVTKLYINDVVVKSSPYNLEHVAVGTLWSPPHNTVLTWARLASGISATDTTIPVIAADNQVTGSLTDNLWEETGYLFFPTTTNTGTFATNIISPTTIEYVPKFTVTGGELVKYSSRSTTAFLGCERGFLQTSAQPWLAGHYIGEADIFNLEFDNAPALSVKWPYVTAIDALPHEDGEGIFQAYIISFEHDAFSGKLIISNLAEYFTNLQGEGLSLRDYRRLNANLALATTTRSWATAVAGLVATQNASNQVVNLQTDPEAFNKDFIRRYGRNKIQIDNQWIQTRAHAQNIADIIIDEYKTPRAVIDLNVLVSPALETPDRIKITSFPQMSIVDTDYHIIQMTYAYDGALATSMTVREVKS